MSKKLKFFIGAVKYYTKVNKTFYPTGFEAGLDQTDADKLDIAAQELAVEIVGASNARPLWSAGERLPGPSPGEGVHRSRPQGSGMKVAVNPTLNPKGVGTGTRMRRLDAPDHQHGPSHPRLRPRRIDWFQIVTKDDKIVFTMETGPKARDRSARRSKLTGRSLMC